MDSKRKVWKYEHLTLFSNQKVIRKKDGRGDESINQNGWIPGWLTCVTPAEITLDLGAPVLVSKMTMSCTNILASPRGHMTLYSSSTSAGPWRKVYEVRRAQNNRLGLAVPGNTDKNDCESSCHESHYFLGHFINNPVPIWKTPGNGTVNEHDFRFRMNRGIVLFSVEEFSVARFWKIEILADNGEKYVGINNFALFGRINPLPAPTNIAVSTQNKDGHSEFVVSWSIDSTTLKKATSIKVVAFGSSVGRGSCGFERTCPVLESYIFQPIP